jgi:magnesium-transporting ATPase (P-type)
MLSLSVSILSSDKTGALTLNQLTFDEAAHADNDLAGRGLRALGVARTFPGKPDEW